MAKVGKFEFKATGKVIKEPGWRVLFTNEKAAVGDDGEESIMPDFKKGESGPHSPALLTRQTQPPKFFTEGTLLRAMESAGKTVDDEELRDALKENGIGRPSTRAAIIETLFKRGYLIREKKNIHASNAGIALISLIKEELLKSAKLTGIWENKLRKIERGEYNAEEFLDELKSMIEIIVHDVMSDPENRRIITRTPISEPAPENSKKAKSVKPKAEKSKTPRITKLEQVKCPKCGEGHILKGRKAFGCSRYAQGCSMTLPFELYPANLSPTRLNTLIKKQYKA